MRALLVPAVLALSAAAAQAVTVADCGDHRSDVRAIAEPWEANTRTFAKGDIRVVVIDTIEPGAGAFHLLVLHPPFDEMGGPQCHVVSVNDYFGFAGMDLGPAGAAYDPARGLTVTLPVSLWNEDGGDFADALLSVTINQASGAVTASVR
ncbi:hypothetical protein LHP98_05920 [Rhodobacter sp. Har01]|uniref:hypothetical protein n=1 Tax=Rhodobacter sp. Har01 TaxID=2883999 RepID=UPI001D05C89C|nr:hypothetical protein [Rhodobacter sp. Har01]MCB6177664.1 hypothetical protein [Rhodobacter sp. Har01]